MINNFINLIQNNIGYSEYGNLGDLLYIILFIILIALLVIILEFVIIGLFLNKYNKLLYGEGSILAFIPLAQTYLLGKLAFNKLVGIIMVAISLLPYLSIPKNDYILSVGEFSGAARFFILIYAIIKYNRIKKGIISKEKAAFQSDQYSFITKSETNVQTQSNKPSFCQNCGAKLIPESSFCQECGHPIEK